MKKTCSMEVQVVFIFLIFLIGVLVAAGCLGKDYVPDHDVIVIKLSSNGSLEWSKVIDSGMDDKASIMIPTSDGGVIIPANSLSLIRISKDGTILWETDFRDPICPVDALIQLQDGGIVTGSSATGVFCKIDGGGNLVWNQSYTKTDSVVINSVRSIIETNDGGLLVAGNYLTRLDHEGRPIWQHSYATEGYKTFFSVIEMKKSQNILGLSQKNDQLEVIQLDRNGVIIANSSLGMFTEYSIPRISSVKNKYSILFFNTTNSTVETVSLDADAKIMNKQTLMNASIPSLFTGEPNSMTNDEGFVSVILLNINKQSDYPWNSGKTLIGGKKLDGNGIEIWTTTPVIFCKPDYSNNINTKFVIQTSDGGYTILGSRDNFYKC